MYWKFNLKVNHNIAKVDFAECEEKQVLLFIEQKSSCFSRGNESSERPLTEIFSRLD